MADWSKPALTHHKVGHVEQFDEIRLDTAYHFSTRSECPRCPVVQLCKGACLFLEGQFWTTACDNAFTHNLAVLAAAIYYQTQGLILTRITADGIRRDGITSLEVIDLRFVESNGDMATVAPPPRLSKPFPVQVVAA